MFLWCLIFLTKSLVFPILLFSSISLHWSPRRLSYLFLLFFGTLHSNGYIFPFFLCLSLLFFSRLFVRPLQATILPFCISFLGMVLITVSCTMSWTSIHSSSGTLSIRSSPLHLFVTLYSHKRFDLDHTWMWNPGLIFITNIFTIWRRQWQPTPVLLPGKSHVRRSLVGCSPMLPVLNHWKLNPHIAIVELLLARFREEIRIYDNLFYFQSAVLVFYKYENHSVLKFGEKTRLILSFSSEHALWDGVVESSTLTLISLSPLPQYRHQNKVEELSDGYWNWKMSIRFIKVLFRLVGFFDFPYLSLISNGVWVSGSFWCVRAQSNKRSEDKSWLAGWHVNSILLSH